MKVTDWKPATRNSQPVMLTHTHRLSPVQSVQLAVHQDGTRDDVHGDCLVSQLTAVLSLLVYAKPRPSPTHGYRNVMGNCMHN